MEYLAALVALVTMAAWVWLARLGFEANRASRERVAYAAEMRRTARVMAVRGGTLAGAPRAVLEALERCAGCGLTFLPGHLCRTHRLCGFCHPIGSDHV